MRLDLSNACLVQGMTLPPSRGDRRHDILQVAEEAFARKGFNGVGMRELAYLDSLKSANVELLLHGLAKH
jgi:DNA-binding transcriptional regulator YbjK